MQKGKQYYNYNKMVLLVCDTVAATLQWTSYNEL